VLPEGASIGGFRVVRLLGMGGMGTVYEAHEEALDRPVALKVLNPDLCTDHLFIERFRREARAAAAYSHPNITHIYSIGEADGVHFYAMELVKGKNLAEILEDEGHLAVEAALDIARQTALGLRAAAARGIIHRDIKPSNILLTAEKLAKITDFGLAKAYVRNLELTTTGTVMGTPLYMSPEQGRGGTVDARSDIYSLGATLYHLVYGCPPFGANSAIALILKHIHDPVSFPERDDVPPEVVALLARMLAKDPARRYPHYDALIADISRTLGEGDLRHARTRTRPQVVVLQHANPVSERLDVLRTGRLSVAKANLKVGRRDRAVSLLREIVRSEEDAAVRVEAALLLFDLRESEGLDEEARTMAQTILECAEDAGTMAYASWKLACLEERAAIDRVRRSLARYERMLDDSRCAVPRELLESRADHLREILDRMEQALASTEVILGDAGERK
jgi:predicted Ser/Thr protein kinase